MIALVTIPAISDTASPWPNTPAQTATPAIEAIPQPPTRTATLPARESAVEPPRKPEIGVDIGGVPHMDVLYLRCSAVNAHFGPLLTGLHRLAAHVHRQGAADLRLLVGPLPTIGAVTQLCTRFVAASVTCGPAKFEGEQIVLR